VTLSQRWDLSAGALYLRLAEGKVSRTAEISDDVNVDLDWRGEVVGIEVLAPGTLWPLAAVIRRFPQISDEAFAELAAGYPFPPPVAEVA